MGGELMAVVNGDARWYCPPEQAEYWAEQGCTVYELVPRHVAGPEAVPDAPEGSGSGTTTIIDLPDSVSAKSTPRSWEGI